MSSRWRRLLCWVLALWLPLHGGAALALGLCAAMQLQAAAVAAEPCHGHGLADGAAPAAEQGNAVAHEGGACAHCAACQVQAATAPDVTAPAQAAPRCAWAAASPAAPPERAPDSLERPPRVTLA